MKYVAFLDILGFKEKLRNLNQVDARKYISSFSTTVYSVWNEKDRDKITGFVVSDSIIINTSDTSAQALEQLLDIIDQICKREFSENSILLRGAISKGEFDKIEAKELSTLSKGLIVGQAYVDAYLLEGTVKTIGIVLSEVVFQDIQELTFQNNKVLEESSGSHNHYILKYLDIDFLLRHDNLRNYIVLAIEAKWLPHYYNTLYFSLKSVSNDKKVSEIFSKIISIIDTRDDSANWRGLDMFIKNAFNNEVNAYFQTRFLRFIRMNIKKKLTL